MQVETTLRAKLVDAFAPVHLEVVNESRNHGVPPGSETHFKVHVVSAAFEGWDRVERHRRVHALLAAELAGPVHALSLKLQAPGEWSPEASSAFRSPPCLGGSKVG